MVVDTQAVPRTEHPIHVYRVDPSQDCGQIRSVGPLPLYHASPPALRQRSSR